MNVHFSSKTDDWATPPDFFAKLDEEFHFVVDVCASRENSKCNYFYATDVDGLKQEWANAAKGIAALRPLLLQHEPYAAWMNPPYGREIGKWVKKAHETALQGVTVVCLLPARTDTKWWHDYVLPHAEVRFVKGRLKFGGSKNAAPFPSAVVIFRPPATH